MSFHMLVPDNAGAPDPAKLDEAALIYYLDNERMRAAEGAWEGGTYVLHFATLWLIAVQVQQTGEDPQWAVYAYTSRDEPGWPDMTYDQVPAPTAEALAQLLAGSGHTVVLRRYKDFQTVFDATTLPVVL